MDGAYAPGPNFAVGEFTANALRDFLQPDETAFDLLADCYSPPLPTGATLRLGLVLPAQSAAKHRSVPVRMSFTISNS